MSSKRFLILTFVVLVIVGVIIAVVLTNDDDTGDFNIRYVGNAKKYESFIKQGVNRWSSIGTGGVSIIFKIQDTISSVVIANTYGNTITISESIFKSQSSFLKVLTIAHEVGHVLGIGTWNTTNDVLVSGNLKYLSEVKYPLTAAAYIDKVRPIGQTVPGPPLENGGHGGGSDLVHWEDSVNLGMERDLMVYKISASSSVISIIDLTFLKEIGREVDLSQAQTLKGTLSSIIGEYVFGKEELHFKCGTCNNCY